MLLSNMQFSNILGWDGDDVREMAVSDTARSTCCLRRRGQLAARCQCIGITSKRTLGGKRFDGSARARRCVGQAP